MSVYPMQEVYFQDIGGGGANEKLAPHLVKDNQSAPPDESTLPLKNVHTDTIGAIVKRKGYTVYGGVYTDVLAVTGLFQYRTFDGTEYELLTGSSGATKKIYDISSPASPVDITGAVTITADSPFDFALVADTLLMTTEARNPPMKRVAGGTVVALGGSPPAGKYVDEFFNYAFISNTASNPERAYWSGLFDVETWTATNFKRMEGPITGQTKLDSNFIFFTANSMTVAQYTGDSLNPFNFQRLESNIGCVSNRSIVNIDGTLYWMGSDSHIYRMSGNLQPQRATEAIPKTIASLLSSSLTKSCAVEHRELRQYWIAVTKTLTTNDFVIAIDYLNNEIFFYDGMAINSMTNISDSSGRIRTYFGDRTGRVYLTNEGNIDYPAGIATSIEFWRYSKQFNLGSPGRVKRFRKLTANVNTQGNYLSSVESIIDYGATSSEISEFSHSSGDALWGTMIWGAFTWGKKDGFPQSKDLAGTGKYVQLHFFGDAQNQPVTYYEVGLKYQTLNRI
jgi:hypothetical protein